MGNCLSQKLITEENIGELAKVVELATRTTSDVERNGIENGSPEVASMLQSLVRGENFLLLTTTTNESDQTVMRVVSKSMDELEELRTIIKILSYRWGKEAAQFSKAFNWSNALQDLVSKKFHDLHLLNDSSADFELAKTFHDSLLGIFRRTGIKYLWVDQLCIPQARSETIKIVHAAGMFYKKFEVLIWVPWVLKDERELGIETGKLSKILKDKINDDTPFLELAQQISALYVQCRRGWILREVGCECVIMPEEHHRNVRFIQTVQSQLNQLIEKKSRADVGNLADESVKVMTKGATEASYVLHTLGHMTGSKPTTMDVLLYAARLSIAEFTVPADRLQVAQMDGLIEVVNVHASDAGTLDEAGPLQNARTLLRMLTFIGSGAFRGMPFSKWQPYTYAGNDCLKVLNWFASTGKEFKRSEYIVFGETQWRLIDDRLRSGHFTGYLPAGYPFFRVETARPFNLGGSDSEACAISVTGHGIKLHIASLEEETSTMAIDEASIQVDSEHERDIMLENFADRTGRQVLVLGKFDPIA